MGRNTYGENVFGVKQLESYNDSVKKKHSDVVKLLAPLYVVPYIICSWLYIPFSSCDTNCQGKMKKTDRLAAPLCTLFCRVFFRKICI